MKICGRNMVVGLPQMLEISADFVYSAIKEQLGIIVDAVKTILERTPPELGVDIIQNGIYLTGGSARIRKMDELLQEKKATVKVLKSEDKWYGVTYKEDKPVVVEAIRNLKKEGLYPENLWEE